MKVLSPKAEEFADDPSEDPRTEEEEISEEGDESEEDEEEEPEIQPSRDIRGDIETALEELDFNGSFYFKTEFSSAPNPVLNISGFGRVSLPLSQADAVRLRAICTQAPFGKGERTIIDKTVRDTWELNASHVQIENPAWRKWLGSVMKQVCGGLGVDKSQSKPYCELYKLLLYEKGSHFLPHQDSEKCDGMFATLIVILSSPFTGGAVHLSHGGDPVIIDSSVNSPSSTSVLAWYSDVKHAVQPITSGYRLALAFNVMHAPAKGASLKPSLPSTVAVRRLRGAFLAWRDRMFQKDVPLKIVSLLTHEYTQAELKRDGRKVLKGSDAYSISHLERVAQEYGFRLGLANLECHVHGVPEAPDNDDPFWDDPDPDASEDEEEEDKEDREWVMEESFDLMGRAILEKVEHWEDTAMIPEELEETVIEGTPDDEEFEDYQGNWGPSLERWYRRTVVVIWPQARHDEFIHGKEYAKRARQARARAKAAYVPSAGHHTPPRAAGSSGYRQKRRKLADDKVEIIDLTTP
ncbi:hypothetical protein FRB90_002646 [Tulasnella sp. 427]|nr:hypothetical protein FRB90_002646 [Tulasnella sp. 427]